MFFSFFYEIGLLFLACVTFPKITYDRLFKKKYRKNFWFRFGFRFPKIEKKGKKLVWLHATSVGEMKALANFVKALPKDLILLITATTETGFAEAKRSIPSANYYAYLPFDFLFVVRPLMKRVSPDLFILCESDLWYNLLNEAKRQGAKTALINGKISERSLNRLRRFSFFSHRLFSTFDHFCLQNTLYHTRFLSLGIPQEKLFITGNLKFGAAPPSLTKEQLKGLRQQLGIVAKEPLLVIGSTHDGEEKLILDQLAPLWEQFYTLKIALVPRHPERFAQVAKWLKKKEFSFVRYSDKCPMKSDRILLVDQMGLLRNLYQLATVALVAGSFNEKVGGHNILEPCDYAVPVIFGPHMTSQKELVKLVEEYQCGIQVTADTLFFQVKYLLEDQKQRDKLGQNGIMLMQNLHGSIEKTLSALSLTH